MAGPAIKSTAGTIPIKQTNQSTEAGIVRLRQAPQIQIFLGDSKLAQGTLGWDWQN
jgi:hypothetical protein